MSIYEKYKAILLSARFHQMVVIFILQTLNHYGVIDAYLANALSALFGVSITIGTVDKAASKMGGESN